MNVIFANRPNEPSLGGAAAKTNAKQIVQHYVNVYLGAS